MHVYDRSLVAFAMRFLQSNIGDPDVEDSMLDALAGKLPATVGETPTETVERLAAYFGQTERPAYGWGWIDGEDDNEGDKWIQVSPLDYTDPEHPCLGEEETCTLMVRNFTESCKRWPGIEKQTETRAQRIVDGLNLMYGPHTIEVEVEGGCCTDVIGLPDAWTYQINDYDDEAVGELDSAELADQQRQIDKFTPPDDE